MTTGATTLAGSGNAEGRRAFSFLPAFVALALTGCAQTETRLERSSLATNVSAQQAIVVPPPGTASSVVGVVERRFANAIQQDIALTTNSVVAGQNLLRVQMFGSIGSDGGETQLPDQPLHESDLRREMQSLFPGVAMQRSPLYAQNGYGPFGYATGRRGTDLCLYAWQRLAGSRNAAPLANLGTVQLRLRLCQTGATERGLLAFMYGYTINASLGGANWNPYGNPAPADPRLGMTGQPIVPSASTGYDTMLDQPPAPRPVRRARVAEPTQSPPPALPPPPPGAPVVPPPPTQTESRPAPVVPPPPSQ